MKRHYFLLAMLFFLACKARRVTDGGLSIDKDSAVVVVSKDTAAHWEDRYFERGAFTAKNVLVSVQSHFLVRAVLKSDSSYAFEGNILILRDDIEKVADTLKLLSDDDHLIDLVIEDLSDSLRFKSLVLKLQYRGDSDMERGEFVEYQDKALKSLFYFDNLVAIRRKDENTLTGFVGRRDLIVGGNLEMPVTYSIKEGVFTETEDTLAIQYIGNYTRALETFKAYRVRGASLSKPYTIKKGTEITIDTFYRSAGVVRMIINDSIAVYISEKDLDGKVFRNDAG